MSLIRAAPRLSLAIALLATGVLARPASAQAERRIVPLTLTTDSVAWQRVLAYVVGSLSAHIVRAAADSSLQPWDLRLPPGEPQRRLLETQLRVILRARPVTAGDSVVNTLEIGPLRIVGDTARVRVRTDFTTRCVGTTRVAGFGNQDNVVVPRDPRLKFWGAARSTGVIHGDRAGCPKLPR